MAFDWKFGLATLLTLAGIMVPVWLWSFDLDAKSLTVELTLSVPLPSYPSTSIPDLEFRVDGTKVERPTISMLVLANDGAKPIPSADYEVPLEIVIGEGARVVRALVLETTPNNLKPELDFAPQSIKVKPLLLNPKDRILIGVLTSGDPPAYQPRSRIAGISSVKFEDMAPTRPRWRSIVYYAICGLLGLISYALAGAAIVARTSLGRPGLFFIGITNVLLTGVSFVLVYDLAGIERSLSRIWPPIIIAVAILMTAVWVALRSSRRASESGAERT